MVTAPKKVSLTVSPRSLLIRLISSNGNSNVANRYMSERRFINGDSDDSGTAANLPSELAISTASPMVSCGALTEPTAKSATILAPLTAASKARDRLS